MVDWVLGGQTSKGVAISHSWSSSDVKCLHTCLTPRHQQINGRLSGAPFSGVRKEGARLKPGNAQKCQRRSAGAPDETKFMVLLPGPASLALEPNACQKILLLGHRSTYPMPIQTLNPRLQEQMSRGGNEERRDTQTNSRTVWQREETEHLNTKRSPAGGSQRGVWPLAKTPREDYLPTPSPFQLPIHPTEPPPPLSQTPHSSFKSVYNLIPPGC
ncbi:hypothetical protein AAY473_017893 [Plecturocebus cupreus]